ncbi:MAG: DotU family type VI secretion system protein [Zoogloeaceae bacterium]|nr:DotU family type VI secretion system protein [Zoogloeaceae bacterium]
MSQPDDPFDSEQADRTFIMPSPGQRNRAAPNPAPAQGAAAAPDLPVEALIPEHGLNPLVAAASPLFNLAVQLRQSSSQANPGALRESLAAGVRAFEKQALAAGATQEKVIGARYVLCSFLDEVAASTPWGGSGVWAKQTLLVMFHNETYGGEKVFRLLAKLAENPSANLDLLVFIEVVLALGFEGRYRLIEGGRAQLDQVRERLHLMVRKELGEPERELSPRWRGVENRRRLWVGIPVWVALVAMVGVSLGIYLLLSWQLNRKSDPVFAAIQSIRAKAPERVKIVQVTPVTKPRLATFLAPEIKAGLVEVADFGDRSVITIKGDGFFEPGSANVASRVQPLLVRIAEALNSVPGRVLITGHTDNQPIRSARFPSNWHLSQERAQAVEDVLTATVQANRMKVEGRADAEPLAPNTTAEGRARNRRVEITLFVAKAGA